MARRITLALCALTTAFQTPPRQPSKTRLRAAASEWDLSLFSPAKINLFLRIIKQRDDGFHELAALFQAIDLGDVLSFEKLGDKDDDILECETEGMPLDSTNLVLRAVSLLREKCPSANIPGFRILLEKQTPMQAGLGGGSSTSSPSEPPSSGSSSRAGERWDGAAIATEVRLRFRSAARAALARAAAHAQPNTA